MEQIYTIPINEVFESNAEAEVKLCPLCLLRKRLEDNELDLILGASMMEPDIRIKTNKEGFCGQHYGKMLTMKNRLGLGLMLESHLDEVAKGLEDGFLPFKKGASTVAYMEKLEHSCYICGKVAYHFKRMCGNLAAMYGADAEFRKKFSAQPYFCLPHLRELAEAGKRELSGKAYAAFWEEAAGICRRYLATLQEDVSWFCKKFDYRYENEPWYNAKDAIPRAAAFLEGEKL
ncbi:MAG: hypothetical protein J6K61_05425 [Clostridia bacterium]|nr:hypothetical protein [Clostridia bacterium]